MNNDERIRELEAENAALRRQAAHQGALVYALIDQLPALIFVKDLEGRFLVVNRPFAATLGLTPVDLIGRPVAEIYPQTVSSYFRARDEAVLTLRVPITYEEPYRDASGIDESRTMETTRFLLLDGGGHPLAICGITYEITARRRAEEERLAFERNLLETQKLESLGLLAGSIAHDFNNLLVAVLGNASLALQELAPDLPTHAHVVEIELAARRAADLTRQMLAYAGKSQPTFRPVDLNQLVAEMARLLPSSLHRRVALRLELEPQLPAVVGDATQLRQVVMNLVLNGAEAIDGPGGYVTVRTALLRPGDVAPGYLASPTQPAVVLEVSDTGLGMDEATQARIFEPFFTTKLTGRGLGLAAVQGIVRNHSGSITVESAPGRGTSFFLLLPASASRPHVAEPEGQLEPVTGTVLVVDDEPEVLDVARRMLTRLGLRVVAAPDGPAALRLLAEAGGRVDLALIDAGLPALSGAELAQAARRVCPGLPVLLMSGRVEQEVLTERARVEALGFIAKPFTLADLGAAVRQALASSRPEA
jgi:PAS domain S-box-containing protein